MKEAVSSIFALLHIVNIVSFYQANSLSVPYERNFSGCHLWKVFTRTYFEFFGHFLMFEFCICNDNSNQLSSWPHLLSKDFVLLRSKMCH